MRSYDIGNELVFAAQFLDPVTGLPANPSSVVLELLDPNGVTVSVTTASVVTGNYRGLFTPSVAGVWTIRWQGSGAVMAATEYEFEIRPSAFSGGD